MWLNEGDVHSQQLACKNVTWFSWTQIHLHASEPVDSCKCLLGESKNVLAVNCKFESLNSMYSAMPMVQMTRHSQVNDSEAKKENSLVEGIYIKNKQTNKKPILEHQWYNGSN